MKVYSSKLKWYIIFQLFASGMITLSKMTGSGASLVTGRIVFLLWLAEPYLPIFSQEFSQKDMVSGSTSREIGCAALELSLQLGKVYPHIKLTLQNQDHILEQAGSVSLLHQFNLLISVDDEFACSGGVVNVRRQLKNGTSSYFPFDFIQGRTGKEPRHIPCNH